MIRRLLILLLLLLPCVCFADDNPFTGNLVKVNSEIIPLGGLARQTIDYYKTSSNCCVMVSKTTTGLKNTTAYKLQSYDALPDYSIEGKTFDIEPSSILPSDLSNIYVEQSDYSIVRYTQLYGGNSWGYTVPSADPSNTSLEITNPIDVDYQSLLSNIPSLLLGPFLVVLGLIAGCWFLSFIWKKIKCVRRS